MIVFAHLLNDASGSPRMLRQAIGVLAPGSCGNLLFLGNSGGGVLSSPGIPVRQYWYRRSRFRLLTLLAFVVSQIALFMRLLRSRDIERDAVIWVNTVLPFGAAIFGRMTRRKVVYHLHEISITPKALRWFLFCVVRWTSDLNIFVSEAHRTALKLSEVPSRVVPNCLDEHMGASASTFKYEWRYDGTFRVLMIASLRDYKGIPEFFRLAEAFVGQSDLEFSLLVNDSAEAVFEYCKKRFVPPNIRIFPQSLDPTFLYSRSSLLVNLSRTDQWVETFGLTLLEAMAFGIPVIAPPIGGPSELVRDGVEGYQIDSRDHSALVLAVSRFAAQRELCVTFSEAGRLRAGQFGLQPLRERLCAALNSVVEP